MALRVFTCHDCGHKMRFGGSYCGSCYARKDTHQNPMVWAAVLFILIAVIIGLLLWLI